MCGPFYAEAPNMCASLDAIVVSVIFTQHLISLLAFPCLIVQT